MEQNTVCREVFWNAGGVVNEEFQVAEERLDADFSLLDQLFTLICC